MNKLSLTIAVLAALSTGFVGAVHAANSGTLTFTGALTNTSCEVSYGGNTGDSITVPLGYVSFADIGTRAEQKYQTAKNIDLTVNCAALSADQFVKMSFLPSLDVNDPYLLATNGEARGVAIGLLPKAGAGDDVVNLKEAFFESPLVPNGTGGSTSTVEFRAVYVKNGIGTSAGAAPGTLPFVLTYR